MDESVESGSWKAIWRAMKDRDLFVAIDEVLHSIDNLHPISDWLWNTGDWRYRYCQWASFLRYEDNHDNRDQKQKNL